VIELELLDAAQARPLIGEMVDIYQAVFSQPPFYETLPDFLNFNGRISYHSRQPGFRCVIARSLPDPALLGFVYGCPGERGSWFSQLAAHHLTGEQMEEFFSDYFEFAELAVLPAWQRQGLGGRLHDAVLEGLPNRTAVLSTPDMQTNALQLYRKRGWQHLAGGIALPGTGIKYQIMARRLPTGLF
jgi:GNAT superfamily N-acetyltransferase